MGGDGRQSPIVAVEHQCSGSAERAGQHSIRINDQYRICFVWRDGDAYEVEIADDTP